MISFHVYFFNARTFFPAIECKMVSVKSLTLETEVNKATSSPDSAIDGRTDFDGTPMSVSSSMKSPPVDRLYVYIL